MPPGRAWRARTCPPITQLSLNTKLIQIDSLIKNLTQKTYQMDSNMTTPSLSTSTMRHLMNCLERAGYRFHYGDAETYGNDPELAGRHWWSLFRAGWAGVESQDGTSIDQLDSIQDALTHMTCEAMYDDQIKELDEVASTVAYAAVGLRLLHEKSSAVQSLLMLPLLRRLRELEQDIMVLHTALKADQANQPLTAAVMQEINRPPEVKGFDLASIGGHDIPVLYVDEPASTAAKSNSTTVAA